jgi:diguanylate cyclase (GGDEF)-like protein
MDNYFLYITIIALLILTMMCIMTFCNDLMERKQKQGFIIFFVLIGLIFIAEVVTVVADGTTLQFRWVHIISNYLGFALTPLLPLVLGASIDNIKKVRLPIFTVLTYDIFLAISIPFGLVFCVDMNNTYSRGPLFNIYLIMYLIGIVYLFWVTIRMTMQYQNRNSIFLYMMFIFLLFGTAVQIINPSVHVTWLCVTMLSVIYYAYCNQLWNQVDGLTGLLSHQSYLSMTSVLNTSMTLVMFDVDNFKHVNDTCGHLTGDKCLICVAECIRKIYGKHGFCYRIGGDEFCVLLRDAHNIGMMNSEFYSRIEAKRKNAKELPFVSVGYAPFHKGDSINNVKDEADKQMYFFKQQRKVDKKNAGQKSSES